MKRREFLLTALVSSITSLSFPTLKGSSQSLFSDRRMAKLMITLFFSDIPNLSTLSNTEGLAPMLLYGGVAVAVILAMAYFSKIQFDSLIRLLETLEKKTK